MNCEFEFDFGEFDCFYKKKDIVKADASKYSDTIAINILRFE